MAAKKVRVELLDGAGQGVGGLTVKASGCGELQTAPNGQAFFLAEDEALTIWVDGVQVFQGRLADAPDKFVFRKEGSGWVPG